MQESASRFITPRTPQGAMTGYHRNCWRPCTRKIPQKGDFGSMTTPVILHQLMSITIRNYMLLVLAALSASNALGASFTLQGTVSDAGTNERIAYATAAVRPGGKAQATDAGGHFCFKLDPGTYVLTVSMVGYTTSTATVVVAADRNLDIKLKPNSKVLQEVVVTAKEQTGLTSASRIDRDAMAHLQPTSFTDLLELLPGNMSHTPDMGNVNSIQLRETGPMSATGAKIHNEDYDISSLGTLFVVDGAPLNEDANLQNVPSTDVSQPEYKRDATNRGVDMRTISTDNIESVEIVRGIPSAEYGNLTSGLVNIKRVRKATPFTLRFKADEYSKLVSAGKGFYLGHSNHIMNVDASYLDSKIDPRNNLENYKRLNYSTRFNFQWETAGTKTQWTMAIDYTGSFDNVKTDPDISTTKVNEYKSDYNRMAYTSDLNISLLKQSWLNRINLNTSFSYEGNRLERRKQVAPQRASVAPTSMQEGVHDGQYLLSEYIARYVSDGKPVNVFLKLKGEGVLTLGGLKNDYKVGGEWNYAKNYGKGQIYDLTRPLSASWVTRPRAYKDIPALATLSWYAEDNITAHAGRHKIELQLGLRSIQLTGLNSRYYLSGRMYLDPRLNGKWTLPQATVLGHKAEIYLAGGYGLTTKMPTTDYLFPQVHYSDFIQLNYYDIYNPAEHSRVNLRTYINDRTNYKLKPAVNHKWEIRLGGQIGKNHFSIDYFSEKMTSGFRYSSVYSPYQYRTYDASGINAQALSGPPSLESLPYQEVTVLDGYTRPANGSRIDKQGIEFVINTARWQPLATALTVTGAWFRSTYSNSQLLFDPVSMVVDGKAVSDYYVGYYNCNNGRVNEQFNTNFMFDTQITPWGLIFSTSIQCMWYTSSRKLWQNGVPDYYMSAADGQLHPYTEQMKTDPVLQYLVKSYNDVVYKKQTTPIALYVNLKATKRIGKHLKIAVFANRMIDYLPSYKSNGLTVRRASDPYFGMELNFDL